MYDDNVKKKQRFCALEQSTANANKWHQLQMWVEYLRYRERLDRQLWLVCGVACVVLFI